MNHADRLRIGRENAARLRARFDKTLPFAHGGDGGGISCRWGVDEHWDLTIVCYKDNHPAGTTRLYVARFRDTDDLGDVQRALPSVDVVVQTDDGRWTDETVDRLVAAIVGAVEQIKSL